MTEMTSTGSAVNYDEIQSLVEATGTSAAETHGTLCGLLCAIERLDFSAWAQTVLAGELNAPPELSEDTDPESVTADDPRAPLIALYDATATQLDDPGYTFYPLLPDDDGPLGERTEALAAWCQGFLYGLGLAGVEDEDSLTEQAREVVQDMSEITRLGLAGEQGSDDEENAYSEVLEYVRMAVLLVREELRPLRLARPGRQVLH